MPADYFLRDRTNVAWPGCLSWRGESSRRGYPTREAAEARARDVRRHAAAHALGGPDLYVVERAEPPSAKSANDPNYGLRCRCGEPSRVIESRTCGGDTRGALLPVPYRRRRHQCIICGERWTTVELREDDFVRAAGTAAANPERSQP